MNLPAFDSAALEGAYVVTGGAQGLGAAIADAIAARGGTPVVFDLKHGTSAHESKRVDVADPKAITAAVDDVARRFPLRGAVACAGIDACGAIDAVPFDAWERVIRVNLIGTAALVRAALPHLPPDGSGRIVTVASTLGLRALSDASAYCASKFGVVGFTRALAAETAGSVGVTTLIP